MSFKVVSDKIVVIKVINNFHEGLFSFCKTYADLLHIFLFQCEFEANERFTSIFAWMTFIIPGTT